MYINNVKYFILLLYCLPQLYPRDFSKSLHLHLCFIRIGESGELEFESYCEVSMSDKCPCRACLSLRTFHTSEDTYLLFLRPFAYANLIITHVGF